jgi:hypothetical protein
MHPELEKLIEMVIADGQVTDKERAVVIKKAISLDVDPDEVEIYLDGKLHQLTSARVDAQPIVKSNKEGDLKKCPSCGAPAQSFKTNCPECGLEFRDSEANHNLRELLELLDVLEQERTNAYQLEGNYALKEASNAKIYETIKNFPLSNTKENVLEFLSCGFPRAKKVVHGCIDSVKQQEVLKSSMNLKLIRPGKINVEVL